MYSCLMQTSKPSLIIKVLSGGPPDRKLYPRESLKEHKISGMCERNIFNVASMFEYLSVNLPGSLSDVDIKPALVAQISRARRLANIKQRLSSFG